MARERAGAGLLLSLRGLIEAPSGRVTGSEAGGSMVLGGDIAGGGYRRRYLCKLAIWQE